MTEFTFRLLLLLLPGMIATSFFGMLSTKGKIDNRSFLIKTLCFSFLSYGLVYLLSLTKCFHIESYFFEALKDPETTIDFYETFLSVICGLLISLFCVFVSNKNYIYSFAQRIKITTNSGEKDVWAELFNNSTCGIDSTIRISFIDKNIIYEGKVKNFSLLDTDKREIILNDVIIKKSKKIIDNPEMVYLQIPNDDNIVIEILK